MKHVKTATATPASDKGKGRLLALDILRGITIAGMIMVNNPGSWSHIYAPLRHAEWNGLTPTDLVFPFFMFIMGVSTYFSLRKYDFRLSKAALWKILRRAVVIFAIGLGIAWFGRFLRGLYAGDSFLDAVLNFDHIRILGVMPRLAICYGIGALAALICRPRVIPWAIAVLLVGYSIVLIAGHGYEFSENSILYIVDNAILGENHTYTDTVDGISLHLDPEGLLSTIPAIAHMLIGFMCGALLLKTKDNTKRINSLFIVGVILTFSGFLLEYGLPINKKVWSPTFVLTTCGLASSFLALLIWIVDIKGNKRWCRFFEVFGINPLFMYCLGAVLGLIIGTVRVPSATAVDGVTTLKGMVYNDWLVPLCGDATLASLTFALLFIALNWCIGLILYKKKIYIKI